MPLDGINERRNRVSYPGEGTTPRRDLTGTYPVRDATPLTNCNAMYTRKRCEGEQGVQLSRLGLWLRSAERMGIEMIYKTTARRE